MLVGRYGGRYGNRGKGEMKKAGFELFAQGGVSFVREPCAEHVQRSVAGKFDGDFF